MLVSFSISNYKSFKEKQTLYMMSKKAGLNSFETGIKNIPYLLNMAVISGPNASGKSNFLTALKFMCKFIKSSYKNGLNEEIDVAPYVLDETSYKEPSEFEIVIIEDSVLYQYGFAATKEEILDEWLYVIPKGEDKPQKWFIRKSEQEIGSWFIDSKYLKDYNISWIKECRKNTLLLSNIAILKNQYELKKLIGGIGKFHILDNGAEVLSDKFTSRQFNNDKCHDRILTFIKNADVGIENIIVAERTLTENDMPQSFRKEFSEMVSKNPDLAKTFENISVHKKENGTLVELDFDTTASDGTKVLFALAGPLCDVLDNGLVLVVDEINRSLHFKELEYIESLFLDKKINSHNAQLLYTTHDTSVWNKHSREELYIVDKKNGYSSNLYSVLEKENRNDAISLRRRYEKGSYDGLPNIGGAK
ncbi:MAG: ATP-binding protein [Rickettsiales bacterium]|jgi:AAA15 family ATPase/GTPase|nr:ATP-binding protein [Rickettsiales bacterium]